MLGNRRGENHRHPYVINRVDLQNPVEEADRFQVFNINNELFNEMRDQIDITYVPRNRNRPYYCFRRDDINERFIKSRGFATERDLCIYIYDKYRNDYVDHVKLNELIDELVL